MTPPCSRLLLAATLAAALLMPIRAVAQTIEAPFDTDYSYVDLGAVPMLPAPAGGLTFVPGDPDTLLIGGAANGTSGKIYSIALVRDVDEHITGFDGDVAYYADAAGPSGGIDGGLVFGPGGVLFYTSYPDNYLGQLEPGSTTPDKLIALSTLSPTPIAASVGTLAFVPAGLPGAGRFKVAQYNVPGNWYDVTIAPDGSGTYAITGVTLAATIGNGPEGIIYVAAGSPQFTADSVIVSEYIGGNVSTYEVDSNGDPVVATRRVFIAGLTGAEGAVIDPLTGDFLFSTFGGGNRVIVVHGFLPPPSTTTTSVTSSTSSSTTSSTTTSTSSTTGTSGTSTSSSSSSSSSTSSSSSSSTAPSSSSTTSSTIPGGCEAEPVAATFDSIACRLDALRADTDAQGTALGKLAPKLLNALDKAIDRTASAGDACTDGDAKHAKSRLKQVVRRLVQYGHRLRGRAARKKVAEEVREPLATAADAIQADARTLRGAVACPADAPK